MDDESGWHAILVDGWGPLVRAAVCERVEEDFRSRRGVLAFTVTDPEGAPAHATESVHDAVVAAIASETGADLDALGSQAAWATYDDVWAELGRRASVTARFEEVPAAAEARLTRLLTTLPIALVEHAGAVVDRTGLPLLTRRHGTALLDVEGVFRWLATDEHADDETRERAREVVRLARERPT